MSIPTSSAETTRPTRPPSGSSRSDAGPRDGRGRGTATLGAGEPPYLYLTTTGRRTGQPREIEIWFTAHKGRHYVIAEHGDRAGWVRNIVAEPRVAWTVGDTRLTGRARPVDPSVEPALSRTIQGLSSAKYGWGDGLIVELTPESA